MNEIAIVDSTIFNAYGGGRRGGPIKTDSEQGAVPADGCDTMVSTRCGPTIRKALDLQDAGVEAIEAARIEIAQGRVDTSENIRAAAKTMLILGI